jgi:hypothetical protein
VSERDPLKYARLAGYTLTWYFTRSAFGSEFFPVRIWAERIGTESLACSKEKSKMVEPGILRGTQRPIRELDVLWITAGLGCDGDTIAMTAATQPSIEDILLGQIPWIPKVTLHNPFLALANGDDFIKASDFIKAFHQATEGRWKISFWWSKGPSRDALSHSRHRCCMPEKQGSELAGWDPLLAYRPG